MSILILIFLILLLPILINLIFPFRKPKLEHYFTPGQTYTSKGEGISQTIIQQKDDKVYCELLIEPYAPGPPEHVHETFDETATVIKGTLTTKIGNEIKQLTAGDRLIIKKGIYHRFYNETADPVIVRSEKEEDYLPSEFAYALAQLYPLMQKTDHVSFPLFIKICVLDSFFDSIPAGPPPVAFKIIKKIVQSYARIFGKTPYDEKSKPR